MSNRNIGEGKMKKCCIIIAISISLFVCGCASKQTVVCVTPTGTFEPETGQELLEEINKQFPTKVKPREFICKAKYDRLVGWAIIPDKKKDAVKQSLESSKSLNLLQVEVLNKKMKNAIDTKWKTSQSVSVSR